MKSRSIRRYAGALLCSAPALSAAQQAATPAPELDTVTVTAQRVPSDGRTLPVSISVITAEDIAASSARTMQDLLSTQAGIHLVNTTSASDNAIVDLRGFGITGASNTLIMIDGVKQNTNDLSAPSLGVVPLDQVERVEIVRGSGSVQYGGGTTGGVINIITRKDFAKEPVTARATATFGSYGLRQYDAAVALNNQKVGVDAYMQSLHSDGYREHSGESREGGGGGITFRHDNGSIRLYGNTTTQKLDLPGPRLINPTTGENQFESDPRGAKNKIDNVKTTTTTFGLQVEQQLGVGTLYADASTREKKLNGLSYDGFGDTLRNQKLEENLASLRYRLPINGGHSVVFGADAQEAKTTSDQNAYYDFVPSKWQSRQHQYGLFAEGQIRATDSTYVTLGARRQYASDKLEVISGSGEESDKGHHLTAWQLGVRQDLPAGFGLYGKVGRSFRLPNADEALSVQSPLAPQTSTDKELGVTWASDSSSARLSWFRYDLTNEIQYNPLADGMWGPGTGANTNLDPTRRQGIELEGHHKLTSSLTLDANLTWMEAQFRSGTYAGVDLSGKTVPLAPKWLANAGVTWRPTDAFLWNVTAQYVGKSRMDNDQANQFDTQLDAYVLFNTKVAYKFTRNIEGAFGINNILDRKYATYGIRGGDASFQMLGPVANYNLYPAPGRNFYASLTVRY
ncbi:TonB-dependent receptor [Achromobacter xylosoxidans]|uniref:TonB-dependent receptor n=1 Tax=Alcaligenes xylosoxydans xylosoxydans TaxID=85698 RepID=A0A1R1K2E3_ALCXX|nr:TonB-dependent receptor [Achromobacter xylosoxidans]MCZ8389149.1 TonB-dependent receptor [Achromobacter xylosoxidans]OMG93602.1 TonB-dependent receptor [Achromobacter xylosoxidans]BEG77494.1 Vitamin B12 transporter BtuB [Achromobacter xylosoxidans]